MNVTVVIGDNFSLYEIAMFAAAGYFNGYLFRDISLFKIIALFFVLPFCIDLLIRIDNVPEITLPFLLMALVGYWGPDKTRYRLAYLYDEASYHIGYLVRRWR